MRKLILLAAMAAFVVGCGGNGENPPAYPFTGTWAGNWEAAALQQGGDATATIRSNGTVTGIISNDVSEQDAALEGTISETGQVSGTVTYEDMPPMALTGTVQIDNRGHLVGNLQQQVGENQIPLTLDVERVGDN
ncbi:MAG: hypothetical protein ACO1SV_09655 [Fimbriimonas sp.]